MKKLEEALKGFKGLKSSRIIDGPITDMIACNMVIATIEILYEEGLLNDKQDDILAALVDEALLDFEANYNIIKGI